MTAQKKSASPTEGVRLVQGGEKHPWKEFCAIYGHYFRPDGTCICGRKGKFKPVTP